MHCVASAEAYGCDTATGRTDWDRIGLPPRGEFAMSLAISLSKWIVLVVVAVAVVEVS